MFNSSIQISLTDFSFKKFIKREILLDVLLVTFIVCSEPALAINSHKSCDNVKSAIETQKGVFVRLSKNGIMFKNENIANIGFIIGDRAVAVIDTGGSIKEGQKLICQIEKATNLPIRYVINTHVHPDHTMGNGAFSDPDITFIGHKNLKYAMGILSKTYLRRYNEVTGSNISDKTIILPKVEVEDKLEVDLGNRVITITAISNKAHTNNDLMVYDKKTDTLWLSDLLFHDHIPVIGKSGSVNGWLQVIKQFRKLKVKNIIPGHGSLLLDGDKAADRQTHYLTLLRDEIRKNISTNSDLTEAMESIGVEEESKWQMFSTFHKRNISYIFSELEWE